VKGIKQHHKKGSKMKKIKEQKGYSMNEGSCINCPSRKGCLEREGENPHPEAFCTGNKK
jgi:hypothetical protein